jgi:ribosome modulation factor
MRRKYVIYNTHDISWAEEAHGRGYTAGLRNDRWQDNPFDNPELNKAWQAGYKAGQNQARLRKNYRKGELRNKRFEKPLQRDFRSERGYQAKVFASTGTVVATSPPFLKELTAQQWLSQKVNEALKKGFRVSGKVFPGFFDPYQLEAA